MWRLVLAEGGLSYNTVFNQMTLDEIEEANAALDLKEEAIKKQLNKK